MLAGATGAREEIKVGHPALALCSRQILLELLVAEQSLEAHKNPPLSLTTLYYNINFSRCYLFFLEKLDYLNIGFPVGRAALPPPNSPDINIRQMDGSVFVYHRHCK
jgi:hypothetical protein